MSKVLEKSIFVKNLQISIAKNKNDVIIWDVIFLQKKGNYKERKRRKENEKDSRTYGR